jgi:RHS repeat-associated protein
VFDNGQEKDYKYDDQGQRMIKRGPQGETVYVNQFFTQRPGANGTKHVYAGTTRIASKLLRQDVPGANPNGATPFEKDIFFYHPDHIGSTNYVTDLNGKLFEHLEYFPFGEAWVEENSNQQRTPYLFSAKELDEETGLYYFGARYYDPRTSVWQSPDSILEKYLPSFRKGGELVAGIAGGVLEPSNLSLYTYGRNNPLRLADPDGKWPKVIHEQIIDRAFPGLSQEQRQILKDRSAWVDRPAGHTKAHNHEHAMKSPGEDPVSARRAIDQNIKNHEEAAQKAQGGTPESASQIKPKAIKEYGEALHPVTDRTSPAHTDAEGNPRDWSGIVNSLRI